ncbi:MAG: chromate transporter [Lachnospiraceae bacterium]|nr:chromate transporter [Lachnospiraceae bacterium]
MNRKIDLFLTFLKIGAFTFGGGYAMISLIDHECVEKKKWMTEEEFLDMTVVAESTPGPVAINCATYAGYKTAGFWGALSATIGVVLPSFFIILLISVFFEHLLEYEIVVKMFQGIRVAVAWLIIRAGVRLISAMKNHTSKHKSVYILIAVFFSVVFGMNLFGVQISTIYLVMVSGVIGYLLYALPIREGGAG